MLTLEELACADEFPRRFTMAAVISRIQSESSGANIHVPTNRSSVDVGETEQTLITQLRSKTAGLHRRVEKSTNLFARLTSNEAYGSLLTKLLGFYRPLELQLLQDTRLGRIIPERLQKSQLLIRDLAQLGFSDAEIHGFPDCTRLPDVSPLGAAWGCLYVLEGATLGGQIISRAVHQASLGTGSVACSFFSGYREETGLRWTAFVEQLNDYGRSPAARTDETVAAAVATFCCYEDWVSC